MKITLFGAAGNVTGSAYYLQTINSNILVDFGIFQGDRTMEANNHQVPPFDIDTLNAVIITHAHLDHTGRLPLLVRNGYNGPIYATQATIDITGIILLDSFRVQSYELQRTNRKLERSGEKPLEADYTEDDVQKVMKQFSPIPYNIFTDIAQSTQCRVREAGHILGSASIELTIEERERRR